MASHVAKFVSAVVAQGDVTTYRSLPSVGPLLQFCEPPDQKLFGAMDEYVRQFKALPTPEVLFEQTGQKLDPPNGEPEFWVRKIEHQHLRRGLAMMANGIGEHLSSEEPEELLKAARAALRELEMSQTSMRVVDFRQGMSVIEKSWAEANTMAVTLGWPTLDNMMGGARPGDLLSMVARPKLGKTYLMAFSALHVWAVQRRPVLFVSNEMVPELIVERLAALATNTPATMVKTNQWPSFGKGGFMGKQSENKVKQGFVDKMHVIESDDVPLWIVDANHSATVDDVAVLAEKLGVCIVYDDGAYLHQDDSERDYYRRVGKTCLGLKQKVATALRIPVFASWQFSREAVKLKPGEKPGIEHIAHNDAIGQSSSCVMGMFEGENIEAKLKREVSILAGRSGEVGHFYTHWDFIGMNLSEYQPQEEEHHAAQYEIA